MSGNLLQEQAAQLKSTEQALNAELEEAGARLEAEQRSKAAGGDRADLGASKLLQKYAITADEEDLAAGLGGSMDPDIAKVGYQTCCPLYFKDA
jgi:hypothetical protein